LCVPGVAIEIAGEYLLRFGSGPVRITGDFPVSYYAQALDHRLPEFAILSSISIMVMLILLTAASVICYRDHVFGDQPTPQSERAVANLDSAPV